MKQPSKKVSNNDMVVDLLAYKQTVIYDEFRFLFNGLFNSYQKPEIHLSYDTIFSACVYAHNDLTCRGKRHGDAIKNKVVSVAVVALSSDRKLSLQSYI